MKIVIVTYLIYITHTKYAFICIKMGSIGWQITSVTHAHTSPEAELTQSTPPAPTHTLGSPSAAQQHLRSSELHSGSPAAVPQPAAIQHSGRDPDACTQRRPGGSDPHPLTGGQRSTAPLGAEAAQGSPHRCPRPKGGGGGGGVGLDSRERPHVVPGSSGWTRGTIPPSEDTARPPRSGAGSASKLDPERRECGTRRRGGGAHGSSATRAAPNSRVSPRAAAPPRPSHRRPEPLGPPRPDGGGPAALGGSLPPPPPSDPATHGRAAPRREERAEPKGGGAAPPPYRGRRPRPRTAPHGSPPAPPSPGRAAPAAPRGGTPSSQPARPLPQAERAGTEPPAQCRRPLRARRGEEGGEAAPPPLASGRARRPAGPAAVRPIAPRRARPPPIGASAGKGAGPREGGARAAPP